MTTLIPKYDQGSTGALNRPINAKLAEIPSLADFDNATDFNSYCATLTSPVNHAIKPQTTIRTLTSKIQESVSVVDFGADPTGVADSTSAFQAAINSTGATTGGRIFVPMGTYLITSTLTINNLNSVYITGCGFGSIINFTSTTADCILINGTSTGTIIENIWLVGSATASAGTMINIATSSNPACYIKGVIINRGWNAVVANAPGADIFISDFLFSNQLNIGIVSKEGFWAAEGNINNSAAAAIYIISGLGPFMSNVDLFGCTTGVAIVPGPGVTCGQARFENVTTENGTHGWLFGGSGGNVWSVFMTNCNATGNSNSGIQINSDTTGGVNGIDIEGCLSAGNTADGVTIFGGLNINIRGGFYAGNTGSGISVNSNVNNFQVIGTRAGPSCGYGANGSHGISVATGTSNNYILSLNSTSGNTGTGLSDAGTGSNKSVVNNI